MPLVLTLLYFVIFIIVVKLFSRQEGYYSTLAVFGIGCYIYYIGIPFELYVLSIEEFEKGSIILSLSTAQLSQIIMMGAMAFLAFSLGYYLSSFNPLKMSRGLRNRFPRIPYSLKLICIWSLISLLIFFYKNIFAVSTYEAAYGVRYSNPAFSLLCDFVVLYGVVIASTVIFRGKSLNKILGMGFIVLIFSWGIYTSDKNVILFGLLAVAASSSCFIRKKGFVSFVYIIIGCVVLIYLIKVFSFYRGGLNIFTAFSIAIKQFGLRYIDPLGPFVSLQHILNNCSDLQYGQTYLHIFYLVIPRFLWKERPLDLSEQFAVDNIVNWSPGQGMGYSPLAEAYLNFSWMGPVIQYLLLGLLWGYFWKVLSKVLWNFPQGLWQCLYYILGYYLLILMHRGPVAGLMKSLILYTSPLILIVIFIDLGILHPDFLMRVSRNGCEKDTNKAA